ncbi:hypothetical protein [Nocardioides sp. GXZ039]|uniref:hypothetical protein n=1 Tax=Nocardioides sp. GXZ039 TaxID=3136018 RepID=UPI0030F41B13
MKPLWKVVVALLVVLPLGGYLAGSLVSSRGIEPKPRDTIVITDSGETRGRAPSSGPGEEPTTPPSRPARTPDDDATVITPRPQERGDDRRAGDDNGDDNGSGHDNGSSDDDGDDDDDDSEDDD